MTTQEQIIMHLTMALRLMQQLHAPGWFYHGTSLYLLQANLTDEKDSLAELYDVPRVILANGERSKVR